MPSLQLSFFFYYLKWSPLVARTQSLHHFHRHFCNDQTFSQSEHSDSNFLVSILVSVIVVVVKVSVVVVVGFIAVGIRLESQTPLA